MSHKEKHCLENAVATNEAEDTLMQLASHTHYFPPNWHGRGYTFDIRNQLLQLYPYKAQLFLDELFSVFWTPYLLYFSLPHKVPDLIHFLQEHTSQLEGLGSVCRYSRFDFKRYANPSFAGTNDASYQAPGGPGRGSSRTEANDESQGGSNGLSAEEINRRVQNPGHYLSPVNEIVQGKMEKSFMNFKEQYPDWHGSAEGEAMLSRLNNFREEQGQADMERSIAQFSSKLGSSNDVSSILASQMLRPGSNLNLSTLLGQSVAMGDQQVSMSQQLLQSQAIQNALGSTQNENNFYWLERYYQNQQLDDSGAIQDVQDEDRNGMTMESKPVTRGNSDVQL